jgi:hypothetical protein
MSTQRTKSELLNKFGENHGRLYEKVIELEVQIDIRNVLVGIAQELETIGNHLKDMRLY